MHESQDKPFSYLALGHLWCILTPDVWHIHHRVPDSGMTELFFMSSSAPVLNALFLSINNLFFPSLNLLFFSLLKGNLFLGQWSRIMVSWHVHSHNFFFVTPISQTGCSISDGYPHNHIHFTPDYPVHHQWQLNPATTDVKGPVNFIYYR